MTDTYCEIIPHAGGWVFAYNGVQSPVYPSYRLAVMAARTTLAKKLGPRKDRVDLRYQASSGKLEPHPSDSRPS